MPEKNATYAILELLNASEMLMSNPTFHTLLLVLPTLQTQV